MLLVCSPVQGLFPHSSAERLRPRQSAHSLVHSQYWSPYHMYMYNGTLTRNEALAAVMVPNGFTKAGFSFAICSSEEGLIPLSVFTGLGLPVTGEEEVSPNTSKGKKRDSPGTNIVNTSSRLPFFVASWAKE